MARVVHLGQERSAGTLWAAVVVRAASLRGGARRRVAIPHWEKPTTENPNAKEPGRVWGAYWGLGVGGAAVQRG